ncbi:o-succinylbenzoate synthase [Pleurocapsales cyanobacterium LEGE 06147]|nr:o-succinylbenzoate synthase [Pleurocapsales cyanobacterium LEGE 06147]
MSDRYKFQFRPYRYQFCQPLRTSHGIWQIREGIIISLSDRAGRVGKGEIAPVPWFGSETMAQALEFCRQLGKSVTRATIATIEDVLPACQFGFESALAELKPQNKGEDTFKSLNYSYLLPAGATALDICRTLLKNINNTCDSLSVSNLAESERPFSIFHSPITFKWKIGVKPLEEEIAILQQLTRILPAKAKLRLDANGGLTVEKARTWLEVAERIAIVEFLEQPLPPRQLETMLGLSKDYVTPLALDESVANLRQLANCYERGWRGIFVIKAAIAGSPSRLRQFCQQHLLDAVFSSVFETQIGRSAVLKLAVELGNPHRAVGFGVEHWLKK